LMIGPLPKMWAFKLSHTDLEVCATLIAIVIFVLTYLVLAIGRLPGFRIDRTGAAIIGASLMVGVNALMMALALLVRRERKLLVV